jgi:protein-serine/threonine kinase
VRRKKRTDSFVDSIRSSNLEDFELVKELASGFIGRVYLARHKTSAEYFALKVMSQEGIVAQRQLERVFNEKKIHILLSAEKSYQVVKIYKTFKDTTNIYLILEYQPADLFSLLNQMRGHVMPENDAKFLTAVLVTALESMHELGVVYRDMKVRVLCSIRDSLC